MYGISVVLFLREGGYTFCGPFTGSTFRIPPFPGKGVPPSHGRGCIPPFPWKGGGEYEL